MALTIDDRVQLWSAMTSKELRERSLALRMFDMSWAPGWEAGADKVRIPKPVWAVKDSTDPKEGVSAEARARLGNWAEARQVDQDSAVLTRSGGLSAANFVPYEDALEIPWAVIERTRSRQTYEMSHQLDTIVFDGIAALPSQTIQIGTAGVHFVSRAKPYKATLEGNNAISQQDHPVMQAIDQFGLEMYRENAIDGDGSPTGSVGMPFIIIHPELAYSLRQWLRKLGLSFDPLTEELLRSNPAATDGTRYVGMLSNVLIYSWNHLQVPSGQANWQCYGGVREACAVGVRPAVTQHFDLSQNQGDQPGTLFRQLQDYAFTEVLDNLHRKITIHAD